MVGQWLGAYAPERIDRLVLSNTSPYLGPAAQWNMLIDSVLSAPDVSQAAEMFIGNWFPPAMRHDAPDLIERFRAMVIDRKSTRLNSSHKCAARMPASA